MDFVDEPAALLLGELTHRGEVFQPVPATHDEDRKWLAGQ